MEDKDGFAQLASLAFDRLPVAGVRFCKRTSEQAEVGIGLKRETSDMATRATSELCSNSHRRRLPGNGKGECWLRDMSKIRSAKAGSTAIPFQSEVSSQHVEAGQ